MESASTKGVCVAVHPCVLGVSDGGLVRKGRKRNRRKVKWRGKKNKSMKNVKKGRKELGDKRRI